jgi:hypothetical protein
MNEEVLSEKMLSEMRIRNCELLEKKCWVN